MIDSPAGPVVVVWFRQDLRLGDNPALVAAVAEARRRGAGVLPLYILDDVNAGAWRMGGASRWWLHRSLAALDESLKETAGGAQPPQAQGEKQQGGLWLFAGEAQQVLEELIECLAAEGRRVIGIYWNRCYEPWRRKRDEAIRVWLEARGVAVHQFNGSLLWQPEETLKADGTPYRVFTPFYKHCINTLGLSAALSDAKTALSGTPISEAAASPRWLPCPQGADKLASLNLLSQVAWHKKFEEHWQPGEAGAQAALARFLNPVAKTQASTDSGLNDYTEGRDFPARHNTSQLSPHLHFGEISPQFVVQQVMQAAVSSGQEAEAGQYIRQLLWREFSYSLLFHYPSLAEENYDTRFNAFPWRDGDGDGHEALVRWQQGRTGFPIIDAGMGELWQTGSMHNRVRMLVASFLTKNLMLHWRHGARWFWDCLVDADLANNSMGWQWVAGCGLDAAPYFRIFNPMTQSQRFDPDGHYIKHYVPELQYLQGKALHDPGSASTAELSAAGVELGRDYPKPMVDLRVSRERALAAYKQL